jgi:putative membrane protein
MLYLWLKVLHLFAVISWFAGIFYLPRLFVYHAMSEDTISHERFIIMERKLFWGIMTPSAILALLFGSGLVAINPAFYFQSGWFHAKLTCVFLLFAYHFMCWRYLLAFRANRNTRTHRFYRVFNEAPVILLLAILILVVVKPF